MSGQIDLMKSVTYIFDDKDWVTKIGILLLVNIAFGLFAVFLVGFVFLAAQYGWIIELIRNMRVGDETPMPTWDNFGDKIQLGAGPLGAFIVYMIIPLFASCLLFVPAILAGTLSEEAAGVFGLGAICLWFPLLIAYSAAAWYFFTVGTIRYANTESIGEYFNFAGILRLGRENQSETVRYIVFVIVVQVAMSALSGTGLGGIVPALFGTPILGHLMGQYALAVEGGRKKKKHQPI